MGQGTHYPEPLLSPASAGKTTVVIENPQSCNFQAQILYEEMPDLGSEHVTDTNDKTAGLYEHVYL